MKNKKLLSTVLAATLAATTMAVPVMAEDGGGDLTVEVGKATDVLRVQVPTTLAVKIDQYQLEQSASSGDCQIYSEEFSILNKGNVNVKVDVTSTVSGDVNGKLAAAKQTAKESKSGDAWLAAAAATNLTISGDAAGSYVYDDTLTTGASETYATLNETNRNVATFNNASGDAKQTFYLEKASGDVTYKYAKSGDVVPAFAKFHKLVKSSDTASGDPAVINAAKDSDVYVQFSGDVNMTRVPKGSSYSDSSGRTFNPASGDALYTISGTSASLGVGDYMYGEGNVRNTGAAAFRYIGVLAKGQTWTTKDIDQIKITYKIDGIDPGTYADATKDGKCVQGLYEDTEESQVTGPKVTISPTGLITVSGLTAEKNYTGLTIVDADGMTKTQADKNIVWNLDNWDKTNGGTFTAQLPAGWVTYWSGKAVTVTVALSDKTNISETVTL